MTETILINLNIYGMNKKHIKYFCFLSFVILFSYCKNSGSNILILTNKTNDNLYIDFTKAKSPIDTIVIILKDNSFRYNIFSFENYSGNTNDTDVVNEVSKLHIFKILNNDTLYLPLDSYSKTDKFDIVIDDDFGYYRKDFHLNITDDKFK
jgi:hypothetical protein